ncbi:hypothetical protein ACWEKT_20195 [Nocardia takedensis]|uniref:hypothetical protein n=1 Tax=Nocardia takedensis TaxID=259390 RepID=UPI0006856F18|nr:hypothetical protein [Nocardia takedensis]
MHDAPLYCTPPSTAETRAFIRAGALGMIVTPAQGNRVEESYPAFCVDNGIYTGTYPGDRQYLAWLKTLQPHAERCLFVVAPDVVGDHLGTLSRSRDMLSRIRDLGFPAAFAAQNFMELDAWHPWDEIDCLFLAGDTEWKLGPHAAKLAAVASGLGLWVHMGRVNSARRYNYARAIGCHSVDGTHLVYAPDHNLGEILSWARESSSRPELMHL